MTEHRIDPDVPVERERADLSGRALSRAVENHIRLSGTKRINIRSRSKRRDFSNNRWNRTSVGIRTSSIHNEDETFIRSEENVRIEL